MSNDREIEAKFSVSREAFKHLQSVEHVGRFTVVSRNDIEQHDLYFDTPQRALAGAGATLRVRSTPHAATMTFKGERQPHNEDAASHIANRLEVEVPVSFWYFNALSDTLPLPQHPELPPITHARALVGTSEFVPIAHIRNKRVTKHLIDSDGNALELALDDCEGTRLSNKRIVRFLEVELESKAGNPAVVAEASEGLVAITPGLLPSHATKLGRVMV